MVLQNYKTIIYLWPTWLWFIIFKTQENTHTFVFLLLNYWNVNHINRRGFVWKTACLTYQPSIVLTPLNKMGVANDADAINNTNLQQK